ncbi:alkyl hydroperoxide reductase/ thiol specific antioxidant/ Mal allergen [Russula earlei]|uniref:Alkyl hydroperoxide reductase/ thiol specific antioxidant/ Mal allergen n=1 Tax=Russula earlei TaxID=71964 RepID=A0ACC0TU30_9AGAM|nr:alkyl hydroperoxide reductase/ thiol specific antioxidant/ Mal allergen [Russula earlei]
MLTTGIKAPDFTLYATPDQQLTLSTLTGQKVILVFYPADWSPVCKDQLSLYNEISSFFHRHNATVIGISVDGKWCHLSFSGDRKLHFPLLADFEPKGAVSRLYEVYDEQEGQSKRALYVLDEAGVIRWSYLSPVGINPGADGILNALEEIDKNNNAVS